MTDATIKNQVLADAIDELRQRVYEFGLMDYAWLLSITLEPNIASRPMRNFFYFVPTSLRALAIEWPEESETLNAAAAACETFSVWGDNGKSR